MNSTIATTTISHRANAVVRTARSPAVSWANPDVRLLAGARSGRMAEISSAETAKVAPFAANATQAGATASRIAPIAGPMTTPRAWTVCKSALAGPSRTSPTRRGRSSDLAAFSALPAADARAVNAMTSATGPALATVAAMAAMTSIRRTSPASNTVRRGKRSAMAPPNGPSSTYGRPLQIVAAPTQTAEWVALYTYPSSAALYSQLPICEAALAPISARAPGIARTSRYARAAVSPLRTGEDCCRFSGQEVSSEIQRRLAAQPVGRVAGFADRDGCRASLNGASRTAGRGPLIWWVS